MISDVPSARRTAFKRTTPPCCLYGSCTCHPTPASLLGDSCTVVSRPFTLFQPSSLPFFHVSIPPFVLPRVD